MRELLAITAVAAATGLFVTLPAAPAAADSTIGAGGGGGTYTVQVTVTGNGVGSGGSLGQGAVNSSGGTVSVPSPCGFMDLYTQEGIEAQYGGDKQRAETQLRILGSDTGYKWANMVLANWGKKGTWYVPFCEFTAASAPSDAFITNFFAANDPVLVGPGGGGPPVPKLDPKFLEEIAIKAMTLPTPTIGYNPSADAKQTFVNVPGGTWFWTPGMTTGTTRTVTASAGGVSAKATATYNGTTFTSSGGAAPNSVFCADGGKPYARGATASACQLNFITSSGAGAYTVTASSRWSAEVTSSLGTRALPGAVMPGQAPVKVGEIQTVVR